MAREMKDSGIEWIGEIPKEWELIKGKRLFQQRSEKGNKKELQLLSPSQKYGVIPQYLYEKLSGLKAVKLDETTDLSNLKSIYEGDFCISLRSFQGGFEYSKYNGVVSPAYQVFYRITNLNNSYYRYLFKERCFIEKMTSFTKSFRDGKSISFCDFGNSLIPFPPICEQQSIADFLDTQCAHIDSVIEKTRAAIEEYKKLKQSVITQAVTKGIRPNREMKDSGIEWIGEIPNEWRIIKANRFIVRTQNGLSRRDVEKSSGQIVLKLKNISADGKIDYSSINRIDLTNEEKLKYSLKDGDFLFVRVNGSKSLVGKCALFESIGSVVAYNDHIIRVRLNMLIEKMYFKLFLQSDIGRIEIDLRTSTAAGQFTINSNGLRDITITLPSIIEQSEIVAYLDKKTAAIDSLIQKKEQLITELEVYKKSLIYEYVTGKKEVSDNETIALSLDFQIALLICNILKNTDVKGRIHLQKIIFALDTILGLFSGTQYYRYPHGPYDLNIEKYESIMESQGWVTVDKSKEYVRYTKTNRFFEFESHYQDIFKEKDNEIRNICNLFNVKRTSKAEKMATVLASWNDFLIDGVKPTDEMIVNDIVTNWTENKANISEETWREIIHQLKEKQMIPKGYGKHTLKKEQNDYAH